SSCVAEGEKEGVGAQVLEWMEAGRRGADVAGLRVKGEHSLAQAEVAGGPGVRTSEVAGGEPVGAPFAGPAEGREAGPHRPAGEGSEGTEVEVGTGDAEHVLGLPSRETEREQLVLGREGDAFAGREGDGHSRRLAEAVDEAAPDRERRMQRDL